MTPDVASIQLARCIRMAINIRESSYDHKGAAALKNRIWPISTDHELLYGNSLIGSVEKACKEVGCIELAGPVILLLTRSRADAAAWSKFVLDTTEDLLSEDEIHETIVIKRKVLEMDAVVM